MEILFITEDIGLTAPGIVYERLIEGLSKYHDIDLLTTNYNADIKICNNIIIQKYNKIKNDRINYYIDRMQIGLISTNINYLLWSKKAKRLIKRKYDLIFSFISFSHYLPLIAGVEIAKNESKLFVYSVDAIPPPKGWLTDTFLTNGIYKLLKKKFLKVDAFFSSNENMLAYQLQKFEFNSNLINGVIYTPGPKKILNFSLEKIKYPVFLYTGGIYGPRKPSFLLNAFKELLKIYPNATLEFIGTTINEIHLKNFTKQERSQVIFHPFTKNLNSHYERSTALIDIDADLPNDVFLSSKITNYIFVNRIIISETGLNSPSRNIFNNIPSIIQCNHNQNEIYRAFLMAIELCEKIDFSDRKIVQNIFNIDTIVKKLNEFLN